jgi:DNA mismatch repair ATPase MutL
MEIIGHFMDCSLMDFFYNHSLLLPDVEYVPGESVQLRREDTSITNKLRYIPDQDILAVHRSLTESDTQKRTPIIQKAPKREIKTPAITVERSEWSENESKKVLPQAKDALPKNVRRSRVDACVSRPEVFTPFKISWQNLLLPMPPKKITRLNLPSDASIYMRFTNEAIHEADVRYDPDLLRRAIVLNQIDRKFIACCHRGREVHTILLVDQHAADERIQLERLIREFCEGTGDECCMPLDQPLQMHIFHEENEAVKLHIKKIEKWHFRLTLHDSSSAGLQSTMVPLWIESVPQIVKNELSHYPTLPIRIMRNIIGLLMNGDIKNQLPEPLLELLKSKSCRSKFLIDLYIHLLLSLIESLFFHVFQMRSSSGMFFRNLVVTFL